MNVLQLFLLALVFIVPLELFSQAAPHDSLLFDGQCSNSIFKSSCTCKAKVKKCDGEARGFRLQREVFEICGQKETTYTVINSILTEGDEVMTGDEYPIYTEDGKLKLELETGIIIHFAEKTKIAIDVDYCCKKSVVYKLVKGTICFEAKGHEGTEVTCKTRNSIFNDFLTLYSIESTDEVDILRVYEGTVKASIQNVDNSESKDIGEKMRQAGQDLQAGKITAEEFGKKAKEYSDRIRYLNEHMVPANVEQGNKCTLTKSSLIVEPIESTDDRWWEK